jgi:hypothetical protein
VQEQARLRKRLLVCQLSSQQSLIHDLMKSSLTITIHNRRITPRKDLKSRSTLGSGHAIQQGYFGKLLDTHVRNWFCHNFDPWGEKVAQHLPQHSYGQKWSSGEHLLS